MKVKHRPVFNVDGVEKLYSERDGVPVKYVCTTDLNMSDVPSDVFYRETPHPKFGNRYFGLYRHPVNDQLMITNADAVEDMLFGCVENDDGELVYSRSHHEYLSFNNGNMIDGGRQYTRSSNGCIIYRVHNGEFYESTN